MVDREKIVQTSTPCNNKIMRLSAFKEKVLRISFSDGGVTPFLCRSIVPIEILLRIARIVPVCIW